jgi:hypothetical protein
LNETQDWQWLVKTAKGDFHFTIVGPWTQEEAAKKVRQVFELLQLEIIGMIPRKRSTVDIEMMATIVEQLEPKNQLGFEVYAGKGIWRACGKEAEYLAQRVLTDRQLALEAEGSEKNKQ